jgi:hypothetical protein
MWAMIESRGRGRCMPGGSPVTTIQISTVVLRRRQPPANHVGKKRTAFRRTDNICEVCPHSTANVDLLHAVHCGQLALNVVDESGSVCAAVHPVSKRVVGFGQHAFQRQLLKEILPLQHVRVDREVAAHFKGTCCLQGIAEPPMQNCTLDRLCGKAIENLACCRDTVDAGDARMALH